MAEPATNKRLFRQVVDALNERDFDAFAETHADDVLLNDNGEEYHGIDTVVEHERTRYEAFPDMEYAPAAILAEGDMLAGQWMVTGTHEREFEGIPPTGETVEFPASGVMQIDDGKIATVWLTYDRLGMLQQLGAVEQPTG